MLAAVAPGPAPVQDWPMYLARAQELRSLFADGTDSDTFDLIEEYAAVVATLEAIRRDARMRRLAKRSPS